MLEREKPRPIEPIPSSVSKIKPIPFQIRGLNWDLRHGFNGGPRLKPYQMTLWSWLAAGIDTLILIAASCVFLIVFSLVVQDRAAEIFISLKNQHGFLSLFLGVLVALSWFYLIFLRSFFGLSIGEWACGLRLGLASEAHKSDYTLRVILRTSVTVLTGVVTLPALSLFLGTDVAGKISGLRLFPIK